MLDDRERRILADLERNLGRPRALGTRHSLLLGPPWWPVACVVLGLALAIFLVTLGLVGNAALLLAVAAAPMATRLVRHLVGRRDPRPERPM